MRVLRTFLAAYFFLAFAVGSILLGGVAYPVLLLCGRSSRQERRLRALVQTAYRLFVWGGGITRLFRVEISAADRARLRQLKGAVVVANHLTLIDIVILLAELGDATAVAKAAAARNPFYARIVKNAFLVNDNPEGVLDEASRLLTAGTSLVIFPEGTRTPAESTSRRLHRGAAQIALVAGAPIVPIRLVCTPPVLGKGQAWYDVGAHTVVYSLTVMETLDAFPVGKSRHATAMALTEKIGRRLFASSDKQKTAL